MSESPNDLWFLIKKSGEHAVGNAWKIWKRTSYLYQFYLPVSFQKCELHCRSFSEIAARSSAAAWLRSRNFSIIAQSNWQRELFLCLLFWLPRSTCRPPDYAKNRNVRLGYSRLFHWKQRQFRWKTGWVLWRTHSKKTEPKFVKTSSVFFETDDIFRACFAITHL